MLDTSIHNVRPLSARLLVRRAPARGVSKGGILIPDTAKKLNQKGEVLAVGPGKLNEQTGARIPLPVQVGDTILFGKHAGFWGELDDRNEVYLVQWDDVLAVVDPNAVP